MLEIKFDDAARDCVLMPKTRDKNELDIWDTFRDAANAKAGSEDWLTEDMLDAGIAALVAAMDRREKRG